MRLVMGHLELEGHHGENDECEQDDRTVTKSGFLNRIGPQSDASS
jgi:hypothetical protein